MFYLGCVELAPNELSRIGFGEREDGTLYHRSLRQTVDGCEGIAVMVLARRIVGGKVGSDELGSSSMHGAAEGFKLTRLYQSVLEMFQNVSCGSE